jgi:hypothetical protein
VEVIVTPPAMSATRTIGLPQAQRPGNKVTSSPRS